MTITRCSPVLSLYRRLSSINHLTTRYQSTQSKAAAFPPPAWEKTLYWSDKHETGESKFGKVLIANRGEIACRVIQTCRRLGIRTVAVHSDVDSFSKHVQMADEAVCIGPAQSAKSYLRMDNILEAVKKTGAEAVHPGYGFLSENTVFAAELAKAGVAFIGPNSKAIHAMGDKLESKRIAMKAKVNLVAGFDGEINDELQAVTIAKQIGFPVMIKASAGGGGKGMRIAWNEKEVRDGYRLSRAEAKSSFGDDRMLVEKYIDSAHHIEIQVLCDQHGNGIYLNERECSIQRRNQKVVEEAPSPFMTPDLRKRMGEQAVSLALAVGYDSAGTVEFLVDSKRNFYFLEMNTRLQVEHPITECTTGIDIVHQMLRVAKGHKLLHKQSDIQIRGHSIEARVYAEDPTKAFGLPSIGRLKAYVEPTSIPNVRCDSGIREGSEISIYYDPLICKLITYGPNRDAALGTMRSALDKYVIRGVTHNIALLRDIVSEPTFLAGNVNTKYLPTVYPEGFKGKQLTSNEENNLLAVGAVVRALQVLRHYSIGSSTSAPSQPRSFQFTNLFHNKKHQTAVELSSCGKYFSVSLDDGKTLRVPNNFTLSTRVIDTQITNVQAGSDKGQSQPVVLQLISYAPNGEVQLQYLGTKFTMQVYEERAARFLDYMPKKSAEVATKEIRAPMPGLIKSISVKPGQMISEGQEVCVLEAMKMQNSLLAAKSSRVKRVLAKEGATVSEEDLLVELE